MFPCLLCGRVSIYLDFYNEDSFWTTVNSPVQWNLYNKDTIGTTVSCPVHGSVLISEDSKCTLGQSKGFKWVRAMMS